LSALITARIGNGWIKDLSQLKQLIRWQMILYFAGVCCRQACQQATSR